MPGLDRLAAWDLVRERTASDSLRKHALAVETAVRGYARQFGEDDEDWGVVALLHDFDYERYPTAADHPFRGCEELTRRGYPAWVTRAILSHAEYSGVARELFEETGLRVDVGPVIEVFDRITRDASDRVEYHYVLVDYLCRATGGALRAGSDVDAAKWVSTADLAEYRLPDKAMTVIRRGRELADASA